MDDLNDDELQEIFKHCSNETRASVVSLVCKRWYRVERRSAPQPSCLTFTDDSAGHFEPSYVNWHARDTSRLVKAIVDVPTPRCWSTVARMLPAVGTLRRLHISPLSQQSNQVQPWFLPWAGSMGRLECLVVERWKIPVDQYHNIRCLLGLRNLREFGMQSVTMILGEAEIAGYQWRDVIHGLPCLTSLYLTSVTISGFAGILTPANPACQLTNLRSLLVDNPSGVDISSVPKMTNLRQLKLYLSHDTISLHVLERLPRLPHLRDLQINLANDDRVGRVLRQIPVEGFTGLDTLKIGRAHRTDHEGRDVNNVCLTPEQQSMWRRALDAKRRDWQMR